jgi:hypothetical protein
MVRVLLFDVPTTGIVSGHLLVGVPRRPRMVVVVAALVPDYLVAAVVRIAVCVREIRLIRVSHFGSAVSKDEGSVSSLNGTGGRYYCTV